MKRGNTGVWGATAAALVALLLTAQAPSIKIERIEVARPGIYEIEVRNPIPDKAISTGNRVEANSYKNVKIGTEVPAKIGTVIGAELSIIGTPRRAKVPLKVVWHYPAAGLTNPESKENRSSDEYFDVQLIGETFPVFWSLTQDWHLVRGAWTLEVWHLERKLVTQQFQVGTP